MKYECLPCPVCSSIFGEKDDIVVCPKCGTPHHRSCWANIGRCANDDKHSQGFVWVSPLKDLPKTIDEEKSENTSLKAEIEHEIKEIKEGIPFDNEELMKMGGFRIIGGDELIGDIKVSQYGAYVDKNKHKYIPKFYRIGKTNRKFAWNWAGFFFSIPWLFYRKMNALGAVLAAFLMIVPIVFAKDFVDYSQEILALAEQSSQEMTISDMAQVAPRPPLAYTVTRQMGFAVSLFCGMFGNYFYMRKATRDIKKINQDEKSDAEYELALKQKGSVSIWSMLIAIILMYGIIDAVFTTTVKTGFDLSVYVEKIIQFFQK